MNARLHATLNAPLATPLDIKLMNVMSSLMLSGVVLLLIAAFLWWLVRLPVFALAGITVRGDVEHHNAVTVRANVAPKLQGNFFTVDLKAIRQGVERQPWVYRADVRRQGLGSLALDIDEQVPVARWGSEGERGFSVWLNRDGETFEVADSTLPKDMGTLPVLHGPLDTGNDLMARYVRYSAQLQPTGRSIRQLDQSSRLSWSMRLDNGTRVELGRERTLNGADDLVATFVQLYPQLIGNRAVPPIVVDLRYPAGVAVRYPVGGTSSSSTPSDRKGKS